MKESSSAVWSVKGRITVSHTYPSSHSGLTGTLGFLRAPCEPPHRHKDNNPQKELERWAGATQTCVRNLEHLYYLSQVLQLFPTMRNCLHFCCTEETTIEQSRKDTERHSLCDLKTGFQLHPLGFKPNQNIQLIPLWNLKFIVEKFIKGFAIITRRGNIVEICM